MTLIEDYARCELTPTEAIILRELITFPAMVTVERLIYVIWGFSAGEWEPPSGARDAVASHICHLRCRLRWRFRIKATHNHGYSLHTLPETAGELP